jgi:hypothetical protein
MGFLDNIAGAIKKPFPKAAQPDPLDFLFNSAAPSSQDLYADALSQVGGAYQAQLENLAAQERQTRGRAKKGDAQLNAMYSSLARDIGANKKNITGMYDTATASSRKNTANTKSAINRQYSQTNAELGDLFAKLGIEAAAPDAMAGGNADRNMLSGLVDFSGNSAIQALGLNKNAAVDFNTAQQNIAGLTGKNRRSDLMQQLNEQLSGLGQQRNSVYGQMSDAVSQRQYQLEQDALQSQRQQQEFMMDLYGSGAGGAGGAGPEGLTYMQQYGMMGPNERGSLKAQQVFGDQLAPYVMELLTGVANYQNGGVYQNLPHFIRSVVAENRKQQQAGKPALSDTELADLASYFWDQGGTGRNIPRDPNAMY